MSKSRKHEIVLSFERPGILAVNQPSLRVSRGDSIVWTGDFPFAVEFSPNSPCDRLKGSSINGSLALKIRSDAGPGRFKYFAAAFVDGRVVTEDPEIIIEAVGRLRNA